jgi:hypothetical protein
VATVIYLRTEKVQNLDLLRHISNKLPSIHRILSGASYHGGSKAALSPNVPGYDRTHSKTPSSTASPRPWSERASPRPDAKRPLPAVLEITRALDEISRSDSLLLVEPERGFNLESEASSGDSEAELSDSMVQEGEESPSPSPLQLDETRPRWFAQDPTASPPRPPRRGQSGQGSPPPMSPRLLVTRARFDEPGVAGPRRHAHPGLELTSQARRDSLEPRTGRRSSLEPRTEW